MQITKYIHACLLIEDQGEQLLFDPGVFSFNEGLVDPATFRAVTTVIVTHAHPDHLDIAALKQILALSGATVLTNRDGQTKLAAEGIAATVLETGSYQTKACTITAYPATHAAILANELPQNTAYLVNDLFLNPGDSFDASLGALRGKTALAVATSAPWNTEIMVADFVRMMQPRHVIPVHDGYVKPFFIQQRYANYTQRFAPEGITFHALGQPGDRATV